MNRRAFTLIELTVVLLILAIMAGAVTLRLQGPMGTARMDEALAMVADFDRSTRLAARQLDRPMQIAVDLHDNTLQRRDAQGEPLAAPARLPGDFKIRRLLVRRQDITSAGVAISCSRRGLSATYAVLLEGSDRKHTQWLVICGMTGQQIKVNSEQQVREILAETGVRNNAG